MLGEDKVVEAVAEVDLLDFKRVEVPLVPLEMESKASGNPVQPKAKFLPFAYGSGQALHVGPADAALRDNAPGTLSRAGRPSLVGIVELRL